MYGVATSVYGYGMEITQQFDTVEAAQEFAGQYVAGSAVLCKFSDGRWRSVAPIAPIRFCPSQYRVDPGTGELCVKCGKSNSVHTVHLLRRSLGLPGQS